jgi:aspartyl-tRNA(Asn)/glutamyl-tRNA(Gln) amidotransferase subunit C
MATAEHGTRSFASAGAAVRVRFHAMSSTIDRKVVDHVARLACLSLDDAEADELTRDLARIVAYVGELSSVDTTDVPPTCHVQLERLRFRDDQTRPGLSQEEALAQAPRAEHGGFAVPTFVEGHKKDGAS